MKHCRICNGTRLVPFLSLGDQPHCNSFLRAEECASVEPRWPLDMLYCEDCHLVQLGYVVDPRLMFQDYVYVSGTTRTLSEHFRTSAQDLIDQFKVEPNSLVVDIGSNDGTFLGHFQERGMRTVGVDPASNIAAIANQRGIETVNDFFSARVASAIKAKHGSAQLMTAAGVFFHIDDMDDVCQGIHTLLDDRGVFQVQAIYLGDMLSQTSFDNIYHEHMSYYTLAPLIHLFKRFNLSVFDVGKAPIHGGTLMVYVCKAGSYPERESVQNLLDHERAMGWDTLKPYQEFAQRVQRLRTDLVALLQDLKAQGKRIVAYGAPAKGNTLLNYCQIGPEIIDYAVEKNPLKIGLYTPGTHIPVVDERDLDSSPPDYLLLLPWNFQDELIQKNQQYLRQGGKFIIPIPTPHIVDATAVAKE
jgi:SAM-dependent methyltransferase